MKEKLENGVCVCARVCKCACIGVFTKVGHWHAAALTKAQQQARTHARARIQQTHKRTHSCAPTHAHTHTHTHNHNHTDHMVCEARERVVLEEELLQVKGV